MKRLLLTPFACFLLLACSSSTTVEDRGTGGSTGGSTAETGGTAPGGAGATAGSPGSGGATGGASSSGGAAGDAGAGAGASAGAGPCVAVGEEDCFNGADDDCNGDVDCADLACDATAECVPAGDHVGVLVGVNEMCPEGFAADELALHQDLTAGGCAGCSCVAGDTTCTAPVYMYPANTSECTYDSPPYDGGTKVGDATFTCTPEPVFQGNEGGWRVGAYDVTPGTCTPSGNPVPESAVWGQTMKLCLPPAVGAGCSAGRACAPKDDSTAPRCGTLPSGATCVAGTGEAWYTDYDDTRTCGNCSCNRIGGDCDDVEVLLGSDWACIGSERLGAGEQHCATTPYSPPIQLVGTPTNPTCLPQSTTSGSVVPTGATTLCCE